MSDRAPKRRYLAQFELLPENAYLVIHGPTAGIAEAKARLHLQYRALPPAERKGFDLKGQLEALNSGEEIKIVEEAEDPEEELAHDDEAEALDEDDLL